jgi:hypothetical protein
MKRIGRFGTIGHCGTYFLDGKNALNGGSTGSSTERTGRFMDSVGYNTEVHIRSGGALFI